MLEWILRRELPVWFALLGGHFAWTLQLLGGYLVISLGCRSEGGTRVVGMDVYEWLVLLVTVIAAAVALMATVVALAIWGKFPIPTFDGTSYQRSPRVRFMAVVGLLLNVLFVMTILLGVTPHIYFDLPDSPFCLVTP